MVGALADDGLVLRAQLGQLVWLRRPCRTHVAPAIAHALERLTIAAVTRLQGPVVVAVEFHSGLQKEAGPQSPTARLWSGVSRRQHRGRREYPRRRRTGQRPTHLDGAASSGSFRP